MSDPISDTSEVDARQRIVLGGVGGDWKVVDADFARQLVRERNEARAQIEQMIKLTAQSLESDSEVASCSCLCKTPEIKHHKPGCKYRLVIQRNEAREENARLREALQRIANCTDAPDIDPVGEIRVGLHCGVEDRNLADRYEGADYGYSCGVERTLEWASNEAKHALAESETEALFEARCREWLEKQPDQRLMVELGELLMIPRTELTPSQLKRLIELQTAVLDKPPTV